MNEFLDEHRVVVKRSLTALFVVLVLGAVFLAALTLATLKEYSYIGDDVPNYNTISVEGTGEVFLKPDVAEFTFSVNREAATVADAQSQVSERIDEVLEGLDEFDIEEKDIKTVNYNAYPRYEYRDMRLSFPSQSERVLVGYEVNQTISVKVRDLDRMNDIVQTLGDLNVDNLSGPNLTVDDEDAAIAEAREKAIEEARNEARSIARALGVSLGDVVGYGEWGNPQPSFYRGGAAMEDAAMEIKEQSVAIPVGENKITIQVNVTYEIK